MKKGNPLVGFLFLLTSPYDLVYYLINTLGCVMGERRGGNGFSGKSADL